MRMRFIFLVTLCALCSFLPTLAHAQEFSVDPYSPETLPLPNIQHENAHFSSYRDKSFSLPVEPHFKQVKFFKQPPPRTLSERIDRLIHGIYIDIPPKYDHYGYEIRRHMKSILTPHDLHDPLMMPEKIRNAKTARIILDYWKKELSLEMKAIQKEIDEGEFSSGIKTTFRYNQRIVNTFLPEAYEWVDSNIEFLEYLNEIRGDFYINYPLYQVPVQSQREKVKELYKTRQKALKKIIKYTPFRAMIY